MGLCQWGSQWRWNMGLNLMDSSPGKARRPGSISQGDAGGILTHSSMRTG